MTRELQDQKFIFHDATDPKVLERFRILRGHIEDRSPLLYPHIKAGEQSIVIHGVEETLLTESDPSQVTKLLHGCLSLKDRFVQILLLRAETATVNDLELDLLILVHGQARMIEHCQQVLVAGHRNHEPGQVMNCQLHAFA